MKMAAPQWVPRYPLSPPTYPLTYEVLELLASNDLHLMSVKKPQSGRGLGAIRDLFRSAPPPPAPATPASRRRVSVLVRRGRDLFSNK